MIYLKTDEEIELLREANLVVAQTLGELAKWVAPGITTRKLDQIADEFIRSKDCTPGFLGLYGFPASVCISVNETVVHGIPSGYVLQDGDIVSIDCGAVT
jgi:methionyl aminopeptidase